MKLQAGLGRLGVRSIIDHYWYATSRASYHRSADALPADPPAATPVRLIAFHLPQFHRIAENDEWWGPGFTEWSNTTRALPRFAGHYQPRLPGDLGFYDLSDPEVLRRQATLARRGGIYGFCIHNYWFNGRQILQTPLENLLADCSIDLPFCVNWANESWSRRWDGSENEVLLQQSYSDRGADEYADYLLRLVADPRYIRVNGRPLVLVYRPGAMPEPAKLFNRWRARFEQAGAPNPYLVMVRSFFSEDPRPFGLDAAAIFPPHRPGPPIPSDRRWLRMLDRDYLSATISYQQSAEDALAQRGEGFRLFPGVVPAWDNEARRPGRGHMLYGSTPGRYGVWLHRACEQASVAERSDERIVFINAWNEWAEGAYLEPDRHYGYAYLAETRRVVDALSDGHYVPTPDALDDPYARAGRSLGNYLVNLPGVVRRRLGGGLRR